MLRHWACVTTMTFNRDHCRCCGDVVGKSTSMNRNALQLHQPLANLSVGAWVDLTTLSIAEEVIQGIKATLSVIIGGVLTEIASMGNRVVDWAIGGGLLRGVVSIVCVVGSTILRSRAGVHLRRMIIVTVGGSFPSLSVAGVLTSMLIWGSKENRIIGVGLNVLLQVLRTLEGLSAEITLVWLERDVDSNVGGDVVALDGSGTARVPATSEVQVVGALSSDVLLADMLKESLCRCAPLAALIPLA